MKVRFIIFMIASSLIVTTLAACLGINKTKQDVAVYDFGLIVPNESNQQITAKILLGELVADESLNQSKMRYRLNYKNPSRVFFYSESRWATTPLELFAGKLNKLVNFTKTPKNCSLKLKIEAFDQVFQTAATSDGVVQLSALVIEQKTQKIISSQFITERVISPTPNAQGGATALSQASEISLRKAMDWGNMIADNNDYCL